MTLLAMGLFEDPILSGIIEILDDGPLPAEPLAKKLGAPLPEVQKRLDRLVKAGILAIDGNAVDKYRVDELNSR
jgi:DNA-binding Lrp family transcriptional regulator